MGTPRQELADREWRKLALVVQEVPCLAPAICRSVGDDWSTFDTLASDLKKWADLQTTAARPRTRRGVATADRRRTT
jgi:hypothetical protein